LTYTLLMIAGGLALLILGGEFLVRGAVALAERIGISPLLIGLTLVGFGTSTPELVTSVQAAVAGSPGIAVGNIVGSNIANLLLILGLAAMISPIAVSARALARDGALVVATAALFAVVSTYTTLSRPIGAAFIILLLAYIIFAWLQERALAGEPHSLSSAAMGKAEAFEAAHPTLNEASRRTGAVVMGLVMTIGGLAIVVLGGSLLVSGAVSLARGLGLSETLIGLTIVAVGTSMPELVTSIVAALKRQSDVALGNVFGSNIYNTLGIGGVTALISPTVVPPEIVRFDNLVMIGISFLVFVFAATRYCIGRREGALLLTGYVGYLWFIWPV